MGRGKAWDVDENAVLAKAWVSASEDPVAGADQKAKIFFETLHRRFGEQGPPTASVVDGKYGFRTADSCRKHVAELSADAQKFGIALRKVRVCNPTGVNEDDILSMAVAVHMGKAATMDYAMKDYCTENWITFKAWKVWHTHPKWAMSSTSTDSAQSSAVGQAGEGQVLVDSSDLESNSRDEEGVRRSSPTKSTERFGMGSRNAKLIRQEELRTQAVRSMAESAKRKSDALEERNAIAVFSRPEATGNPETIQFFDAVRQSYLSQALKKARIASQETAALLITPSEGSSSPPPPTAPPPSSEPHTAEVQFSESPSAYTSSGGGASVY